MQTTKTAENQVKKRPKLSGLASVLVGITLVGSASLLFYMSNKYDKTLKGLFPKTANFYAVPVELKNGKGTVLGRGFKVEGFYYGPCADESSVHNFVVIDSCNDGKFYQTRSFDSKEVLFDRESSEKKMWEQVYSASKKTYLKR